MKPFIAIALITLFGCGKESQVAPPAPQGKAEAVLFAKTDCVPCEKELKELYIKLSKEERQKVTLYIVDGNATECMAKSYAKKLGVEFKAMPDAYCKVEFKKYYPGQSCAVPAGAVVVDGKASKVYPKGKVDLQDLLLRIKGTKTE